MWNKWIRWNKWQTLTGICCALGLGAPSFGDEFAECISGLKQRAASEGIDSSLVALLDNVKHIERVIDLDRNQPEYTQTFAAYLNRRVTDNHVNRGRDLLKTHRQLLNRLTQKYGVPPQYLVAFWGLETNFGNYLGKMPILDSLATLSCDQRRSEQFARELMIALTLIGDQELELESFQGSWAGAMGHTQFMPSVYQRYGIDGDGDGKVDLWNSVDDALTSAAHYLQKLGWQRELRWGREVRVPEDFDYFLTGIEQPLTLGEWQQLGIRRTNGGHLNGGDDIIAALVVPQGAEGPKFLVYENFHVILNWNTPIFYALSVGHLADRINGAGRLYQPPSKEQGIAIDDVKTIQLVLTELGFDPGNADGRPGPATQRAIREFQRSIKALADGYADDEVMQQLKTEKTKAKPN
jgi:membrane-bound lytic murein transglycosylase B